ncbi:hypothetical protein ACFVP3_23345 [Streptomyces sp. NPDC057806]|uniref:hypothetical protein n=1 Tax=Streptomyces sp. NPDC057806 TaxID=3346255 RepID=UPI0036BAA48A
MSTATQHRASTTSRERVRRDLAVIAGRELTEVRITPALYGGGLSFCAMALDGQHREVPLPRIQHAVADRVRRAFPRADWSRAQDYDVTSGVLTEHVTRLPACLTGDAR